MRIAPTFVFSLFIQILFGINNYYEGDTLTVWSVGGLNLRADNHLQGEVIGKIPFGTKVISRSGKSAFGNDIFIDDRVEFYQPNKGESYQKTILLRGSWVLISWNGMEGYIFDAYLSTLAVPIGDREYFYENRLELFKELFGDYRRIESRTEIDYLFGNKLILREEKSDNKGIWEIVMFDFSFEEMYLLTVYQGITRYDCQMKQYKHEVGENDFFMKLFVEFPCGYFEIYEYGNTTVFRMATGC